MYTIYGLVASDEPDAVRYVGSTRDLPTRLRKHRSTHADIARSRKEQWVVEVKARGAVVEAIVLAETDDLDRSRKLEVELTIGQLAAGARLLNRRASGAGNLGRPIGQFSDEARARQVAGQQARRARERAEGVKQAATPRSIEQAKRNLARVHELYDSEFWRQVALNRPRVSCVACQREMQASRWPLHRGTAKCVQAAERLVQ